MRVRGQERFVYEQVLAIIKVNLLTGLGWDGTALSHLPWGALTALTFVDRPPDTKPGPVAPNTIAISEGAVPDEVDEEMGALGGGLWSQMHTIFVDIYGENAGVAKSIAGDVTAILRGVNFGSVSFPRYWPLTDFTGQTSNPLPGHILRFESIQTEHPAVGAPAKTHWTVVKATCVHEFNA